MGNGTSEIGCCVDRDDDDARKDLPPLQLFDGPTPQEPNRALLLVEPAAATEPVRRLLLSALDSHGVAVLSSGSVSTEEVLQRRLVDRHFGVAAAKATVYTYGDGPTGRRLFVPRAAQEEFRGRFGQTWDAALAEGRVQNALEAARRLGLSPLQLGARWEELELSGEVVRFGPESHCAQMEGLYVVNGFYLKTRARFSEPGGSVHWLDVEFPSQSLSWASFLDSVVGSGPPSGARPRSIRFLLFQDRAQLGLRTAEDDENDGLGVLASPGPFEALVQRMNWLGVDAQQDTFGRALLTAGVPLDTVLAWAEDPAVKLDGERLSLFKCLEGLDAQPCIGRALQLIDEERGSARHPLPRMRGRLGSPRQGSAR